MCSLSHKSLEFGAISATCCKWDLFMWGECVGMHFGGVPIREASLFPTLLSGRPRVGAPGEIQVEIRGLWQEGSLVFPSQGGSPLRQLAELPPWAELPPRPILWEKRSGEVSCGERQAPDGSPRLLSWWNGRRLRRLAMTSEVWCGSRGCQRVLR